MDLVKYILSFFKEDKPLRTCQELLSEDFTLFSGNPYINEEVIRYHIFDRTKDMMPVEVDKAITKVFELLAPIFYPITFKQAKYKSDSNIVINFASNGDHDLPFIFEPGTLGYAFAPKANRSTIWLNDDYDWKSYHSRFSINLTKVLLHEALHSLGIGHTDAPDDIMQPTYTANNTINITYDTKNAINTLYGDIKSQIEARKSEEEDIDKVCVVTEILQSIFPSSYYIARMSKAQRRRLAKVLGVDPSPTSSFIKRLYDAIQNL